MNLYYLDFEQPIAELEEKIEELRLVGTDQELNIQEIVERLEHECAVKTKDIFANLNAWDVARLARHPKRPYTKNYIDLIFTDFDELHGDRYFADDQALIGGLAKIDGRPCVVMGHQKGRGTKAKVKHNFGMPRPEGYRKARRLVELGERYNLPVLSFIDTPGAYPGIDAEERGINEAIAVNMAMMSRVKTPLIATETGEANSGGAIAIGVSEQLNMLQYSTYTVITPEGCATILWKSSEYASAAAEAMGVTSTRLEELGIVDQTIAEPLGGAHRDVAATAENIKIALLEQMDRLSATDTKTLIERRYKRLMSYGLSA
jgi:acetyl-CoA carboxylase carboxyl transferase subunit alpha